MFIIKEAIIDNIDLMKSLDSYLQKLSKKDAWSLAKH